MARSQERSPTPTTAYASPTPEHVRHLDGQLAAAHAARAALDAELTTAEAERARLDGVLEDGADTAYDRAAAVVRMLRRRIAATDAEIADVAQQLRAAHVAILRDEEQNDGADRERVEQILAAAAAELANYETRLKDRWNRRNELGLPMPSRLDGIPGRVVARLAAAAFQSFGLGSALDSGKRL